MLAAAAISTALLAVSRSFQVETETAARDGLRLSGLDPAAVFLGKAGAIAEKRATIACTPGVKRFSVETSTPGMYLAGDYTDPEYPPTLEAAVRSGIRAAERI